MIVTVSLPISLAVRVRYATAKNQSLAASCRTLLEKVNSPRAVSTARKGEFTRTPVAG